MNAIMLPADSASIVEFDWGQITWLAGRALGNSADMTVGICVIPPGHSNPFHRHSNCEEVLHLVSGEIAHTADDAEFRLEPGDTITIPRHVRHNARNVGAEDAVMYIAFSSADRQMEAE